MLTQMNNSVISPEFVVGFRMKSPVCAELEIGSCGSRVIGGFHSLLSLCLLMFVYVPVYSQVYFVKSLLNGIQ